MAQEFLQAPHLGAYYIITPANLTNDRLKKVFLSRKDLIIIALKY